MQSIVCIALIGWELIDWMEGRQPLACLEAEWQTTEKGLPPTIALGQIMQSDDEHAAESGNETGSNAATPASLDFSGMGDELLLPEQLNGSNTGDVTRVEDDDNDDENASFDNEDGDESDSDEEDAAAAAGLSASEREILTLLAVDKASMHEVMLTVLRRLTLTGLETRIRPGIGCRRAFSVKDPRGCISQPIARRACCCFRK